MSRAMVRPNPSPWGERCLSSSISAGTISLFSLLFPSTYASVLEKTSLGMAFQIWANSSSTAEMEGSACAVGQ